MSIDVERLRTDLADDSYAGAFAGMPAMMMEAWEIENASDDEVIRLAVEYGMDSEDEFYPKPRNRNRKP